MSRSFVFVVALAVTGCPKNGGELGNPAEIPAVSGPLNPEAIAGIESPDLQRLLHDHWEDTMRRAPTWATALGDYRFDDQLGDASIAGSERYRAARDGFLARARGLDPTALSDVERTTLALFIEDLEYDVASDVCRFEQWSISPRSNPAVEFNDLVDIHPLQNEEDARELLARYAAIPGTVTDHVEQLRLGLADGWVANADTTALVIEQVKTQLATDDDAWVLAGVRGSEALDAPFADTFDSDVLTHMAAFRVALTTYLAFLESEVLPNARPADGVGMGSLPDGAACYQARVRAYTTLDRSAEDIHRLGLEQMALIHEEFRELGEAEFQTRDLEQIFDHLRTDEQLLFGTSEEVVQAAEAAVDDARRAIPKAFGRLPQAAVEVRPVPENEAPYTTIAYYRGPAADGERPGVYYVNTYAPETRPRHEARVLAFHEAIPGHHLQIAIAQELPDLPAFRRNTGMTAFVEGWALYTERLADELGLYPEDVDRLGMLSFDAWRAARLVVDTGIHSQGWTREMAEAYMRENTPLAENNIANEVDRYISWPGQALAYKTGQLHIMALREQAEAQLGDDFDLKAFHDVVLGGGAVSLPELTRRVEGWLAARSQ